MGQGTNLAHIVAASLHQFTIKWATTGNFPVLIGRLVLPSAFVGVLGAAHLNTFLGFGITSKLVLPSAFVGVRERT